ncbi:MAG: MmcQ/YjbR family DNA-binding protein [Ignavibacteriaceae bacterium]
MDLEIIRNHCLKKKGVTEEFPFGEDNPVYKVIGKVFLLASLSYPNSINLKCDPEKAIDLRERYLCVTPGYHMNKTHWNTIVLDGSVPNKEILKWIDDSYDLVERGLKKSDKARLNLNSG